MACFIKIALVLLFAGLASAGVVKEKYNSAGYSAYASVSFDSCSSQFYSYFDAGLDSTQTKYQQTPGKTGYKSTTEFDSLYIYFDLYSCDADTVTHRYGYIYESSYYGSFEPPNFTIDSQKLTQASLKNAQVAVFERVCSIECTDICYAEIYGYGTCPPDEVYTECYEANCDGDQFIGTANVGIVWKVPSGTNTPPQQDSSTYRSSSDGYMYMSRSKGSYRYDIPVTVTAVIDGNNLFSDTASYSYGQLASTTSNSVTKYKA